ncbi:MAG: hypothetical protein OXN27_15665 [Candidatus Poribacteria bacterium]|nr:hypothetical protein [Candidatus Poribacteria bacterium]
MQMMTARARGIGLNKLLIVGPFRLFTERVYLLSVLGQVTG